MTVVDELEINGIIPHKHDISYKYIDAIKDGANVMLENGASIDEVKKMVHGYSCDAMQDQSIKADAGKPRVSLVPPEAIFATAVIREYGNKKYGDSNSWKQVSTERYRDAMYRHLLLYLQDPHGVDEESGLPHLWHVMCNGFFLCAKEEPYFKEKGLVNW